MKSLKNSKIYCWIALACLVVPMFGSYFFDDMFSTVSHIFKNPEMLELGWNSANFGLYAGGYSFLCVWGGLIICGVLLDVYGVRLVGSIFIGLMLLGAATVTCAISIPGLAPSVSLAIAYVGCMIFGLGSEIAGVAVTRSIAKWFKGKSVALAMGIQVAIARLGTALAFFISPILISTKAYGERYLLSDTNKPAIMGLAIIFAGTILWAIFVAMDARYDRQEGIVTTKGEVREEDKFRASDILKVLKNPRFILIALLCVFFYCCIISFKKFGTSIIMPRFGLDVDVAKIIITMIPFFTVIFTPGFGALVDRLGHATVWMIAGSVLVLTAHLLIAFAPATEIWGYISIAILGIGFSLVPSAMWPSVPKIVPEKNLGTAYSLIYWIQNMGMLLVPIFVGGIMESVVTAHPDEEAVYLEQEIQAAVQSEYIFIGLGITAVVIAFILHANSRKHPELKIDLPSFKS